MNFIAKVIYGVSLAMLLPVHSQANGFEQICKATIKTMYDCAPVICGATITLLKAKCFADNPSLLERENLSPSFFVCVELPLTFILIAGGIKLGQSIVTDPIINTWLSHYHNSQQKNFEKESSC